MNTKLKWFVGSNGNLFGDSGDTRYCVSKDWYGNYRVAANGNEFADANGWDDGKAIAERHAGQRN